MHKTHPRVSIVIPAHNEEGRLRACLESIAAQTSRPYEVIVVDNNSTDTTTAIAASFPFVRIVSEAQQGIVFARNAGFDAATGDIIGRIDADVTMPSNWVAHIQAFYADAAHWRQAWSGAGFFYNIPLPRLMSWGYAFLAFRLNVVLSGSSTLWGSNMAITREQWLAVRQGVHLRTDIHEDLDLSLHIADGGYTIIYDSRLKTRAELRRVMSERGKLWGYVQWWPNTLRAHRKHTWILCWLISVMVLYPGLYTLVVLDALARAMGRR
ncbi:MAG TPA: glycosyltransferase family A protein [Candidatus Saccharimonadales bacterium]|nr:glycosyltransferase family A protein [Candidatus Saccharimonadales bacterium]